MLLTPTPELAARVRGLFRETGYTEDNLRKTLGSASPPQPQKGNLSAFLYHTSEATPLNTLLRWFLGGGAVSSAQAESCIPSWFLEFGAEHGLLAREGDTWNSQLLLLPEKQFWVPAGRNHWGSEVTPEDHVLAPGPSMRALISGILPIPSRKTLDLGTGCGLLAYLAASRSESVVATDLNPLAVDYARFGARLNKLENIDFRLGDAYAPVAGERFDHIIINPPFVLAPRSTFIYRDNPMVLDGFVRELARGAPGHLNEGGFYQMVCEWAEVRGEAWSDRLAGWFAGTGCDVWVLHGMSQSPADYALARTREMALPDVETEITHYNDWMEYYRSHGVVGIHGGLVTMRRRDAENWLRMDEIPEGASDEFGAALVTGFANRDSMDRLSSAEELLGARFRLPSELRLQVTHRPRPTGWGLGGIDAWVENGLRRRTSLDPQGAEFLRLFDGEKTVESVIRDMARHLGVEPEAIRDETLANIHRLVENGFLDLA